MEAVSAELDVEGARLHYEVRGSGPAIVFIPGAAGTGRIFTAVAADLARHHTVVTFDRRGFSASALVGPQAYEHRLQVEADDVRALIGAVGGESATVVGVSSGAVVALETWRRHGGSIARVFPFEPPIMRSLPDAGEWMTFFRGMYELYRERGLEPAMTLFQERTFASVDRHALDPFNRDGVANAVHWFERELVPYTSGDVPSPSDSDPSKVFFAAGAESRGYPCRRVAEELSRRFGREVVELPGGHKGYLTHPGEFAAALAAHLGEPLRST
jgi:pimeloyl-ACP methyl ester carboxylesterase